MAQPEIVTISSLDYDVRFDTKHLLTQSFLSTEGGPILLPVELPSSYSVLARVRLKSTVGKGN